MLELLLHLLFLKKLYILIQRFVQILIIKLFMRLYGLFRNERPQIILLYAIKANIYGSLAANLHGIPVVNNITGLGYAFIKNSWITTLVSVLYKIALAKSTKVYFQNADDLKLFINKKLVNRNITDLLPGSGVDLDWFNCENMPTYIRQKNTFIFLMIARMLWDKGVGEYVEAAKIIKKNHPDVEFLITGFWDSNNPSAIDLKIINEWVDSGIINYLGSSDDVRIQIQTANCVVLPSYREGTPRSLLEAAAMQRPLITTNTIGCKDVVDHGINGLLCRVADAKDLANQMTIMLGANEAKRLKMGKNGRLKIKNKYDEKIVIKKYTNLIKAVMMSNTKIRTNLY